MSQAIFDNIVPTTTSGNQLATILNSFKDAVASGFSGTSRPSNLQAGGYWVDTTNDLSGTWDFKLYTGTLDITVFILNKVTGTASIAASDSLFSIEKESDDSIGPILEMLKKRIAGGGQVLTGDILGQIDFKGLTDGSIEEVQARLRLLSLDDVTSSAHGVQLKLFMTSVGESALIEVLTVDGNGDVNIKSTTTSTDKDTGALVVEGGVGIEENLNVGGTVGIIGAVTLSNTTSSTTKDTGALIVEGGVGIEENLNVGGNLTITGDLTVNGTTTTIDTTNLLVEDKNIVINNGGDDASSEGAGVTVERTGTDGSIIYKDASATKFAVGPVGSEVDLVGTSSAQVLTVKIFDDEVTLKEIATPTTPASGYQAIYPDSTSGKMTIVDDTGLISTTGEVMPPSATLGALNIDWKTGSTFYKEIATNSTFTLSNVVDGKSIMVIVKNTDVAAVDITPPTSIYVQDTITLAAGKYAALTFVAINSQVFLSYLVDME